MVDILVPTSSPKVDLNSSECLQSESMRVTERRFARNCINKIPKVDQVAFNQGKAGN